MKVQKIKLSSYDVTGILDINTFHHKPLAR